MERVIADGTVATLFELAIEAEKLAEELYEGLARKFSDLPLVSGFWTDMGRDEVHHAEILQEIRDGLSDEELAANADPDTLRQAKSNVSVSISDVLDAIETLDDAYELAYEIEGGEVNELFKLLAQTFIPAHQLATQVVEELDLHISKLEDPPPSFGDRWQRRGIRAR